MLLIQGTLLKSTFIPPSAGRNDSRPIRIFPFLATVVPLLYEPNQRTCDNNHSDDAASIDNVDVVLRIGKFDTPILSSASISHPFKITRNYKKPSTRARIQVIIPIQMPIRLIQPLRSSGCGVLGRCLWRDTMRDTMRYFRRTRRLIMTTYAMI